MKPFLLEIAEELIREYGKKLDTVTIVFPNRRAALYFRKHLASLIDKPAFAPQLLTIEDFISAFSPLRVPDKLQLIHTLHHVYNDVLSRFGTGGVRESFDQFYFWGEMLLRDFDEADKYMVNADLLFKDLSHQKEVDNSFDFLTEEQREFLRSFWINFDEKDSLNKQKFLAIWRQLASVYAVFKSTLKQRGLAYEGMLHREVAENLKQLYSRTTHPSNILFAGFNALTKAEESILAFFVEERIATIKWDIDDYYFNNQRQEAGKFFRQYNQHRLLGRTFPQDVPSNLRVPKEIKLYGAAQPLGQAKLMAQVLQELLSEGENPEDTLIVLPDEKLLMPVLHGVSGSVDKLNVTMGFPLTSTPLYNMVELLVELHLTAKQGSFNHRPVVSLLGHPYVVAADAPAAQAKRKEILFHNWVNIPYADLATIVELHRRIFVELQVNGVADITRYLKAVIGDIGSLRGIGEFDREYCFHFIRLLNKIEDVFQDAPHVSHEGTSGDKDPSQLMKERLKAFLRLFKLLIRAEKIPFSGEPLKGLQVMGVLETRNLDFKNVFILSLNEGSFPSFASNSSYIPYNIRKAYGLPAVEQQDAMYAYLFYRSFQRAQNVFLFYNSETDDLGQGEMSRYLQQLVYESGLALEKNVLHNEFRPLQTTPVSIRKDERVFNELAAYCTGSRQNKTLSPSALNDYLECRLKFYFRYVARVREAREVEEELDARVLGNFLHRVMELFYQGIIRRKGNSSIVESDFDDHESQINSLIDQAFINNYRLNPAKKVVYEGQRLVVREIVKRFVDRILKMDRAYAPFTMEALERKDLAYSIRVEGHGNPVVILGGSIDRADRKGDVIRVIDYKTGKDELRFVDVPSLFERGTSRNKAAFQTFLYTLLYKKNVVRYSNVTLVPGLMNRINLFNDDFVFGLQHSNESLQDATPLLGPFEDHIRELLTEIFDPEVPFDQTAEEDICRFCSYRQLCYR
jgi:hypothetical protein